MQQTLKKQHYKFTLYHLETYYSTEFKYVQTWGERSVSFNEKTWVNHSNYKTVFSLDFHDEAQLRKFLKERYKNAESLIFYTSLGSAIKGNNYYNANEWIAIVSTAHCGKNINFQLKPLKKRNKFPKKRKFSRDYYVNSYDWLAREIKRKKINQFIMDINQI